MSMVTEICAAAYSANAGKVVTVLVRVGRVSKLRRYRVVESDERCRMSEIAQGANCPDYQCGSWRDGNGGGGSAGG